MALQWGHALSGMDTRPEKSCSVPSSTLQWGHALSGMDTLLARAPVNKELVLQWGHALSGMDTLEELKKRYLSQSFNGAMPFQAWIHRIR